LVDVNVFQTLWDARTENVDVVIPLVNEKLQIVCALYRKNILPMLESTLQNNIYSVYSFVEKLNSIKIEFDGDKRFWNMNTQDDLAEIRTYFSIIQSDD
jgi:molybdopterin-guanine dinucleotide biosynthesis protein A